MAHRNDEMPFLLSYSLHPDSFSIVANIEEKHMPIRFKCRFRANDDSVAAYIRTEMIEAIERFTRDQDVLVTPESMTANAMHSKEYELEVTIRFRSGRAGPAAESAAARRIADGVGAPWEKSDEGRVRVLAPGTGGFSTSFSTARQAELRLEPKKGLFARLFG